mmetsp:Transcript_25805/g.56128  ORF Transcript_25805/g.56128 Transcript_25805/m.56128 type:complete len:922 (-) Transcript_25805:186-2951(-)
MFVLFLGLFCAASILSLVVADGVSLGYEGEQLKKHHKYCIVGAGPGGIQLGHFLKHANRDYVIYERNGDPGSFFKKYPRHRMLISLNKRFVRENRSKEFAFRHDWNSLLDVRPEGQNVPPVTNRTDLMFPHADTLHEYFGEFAEEQKPHIKYNTAVQLISRPEGEGSSFVVKLARGSSEGKQQVWKETCQEVIVATGIFRPRGARTRVDGEKYLMGYEDLPEKGSDYAGKSVLVLGLGNAAMETVEELHKYTSELHLFGRRRPLPDGSYGIRFAYQTHYVGDIRAGRFGILDTYLLKSLDTFDFNAFDDKVRVAVIPCMGKKLCIWEVSSDDCADEHCKKNFDTGGQDLDYTLSLGQWTKDASYGKRLVSILKKYDRKYADKHAALLEAGVKHAVKPFTFQVDDSNPAMDESSFEEDSDQQETLLERTYRRKSMGITDKVFNNSFQSVSINSRLLRENPELMDALVPLLAHGSGSNMRYPLDHIIRCFGWAMDTSIFDQTSVPVTTSHKGKYPEIKDTYEAKHVKGLHFAGTLGHSLDYRKSAGGFIHGFRYTARAIFRLLEEKNEGVPWPEKTTSLMVTHEGRCPGIDELTGTLMKRINEASGPYQMFETLGDMILFEVDPDSNNWQARYMEDVPIKHFDEKYRNHPRLFWVFEYNANFSGPKVLSPERVGSTSPYTAEHSNFLHPHLFYSAPRSTKPSLKHWMQEDIFTQWDNSEVYAPLARYVAHVASAATGNPRLEQEGAFFTQQPIDDSCFSTLEQSLLAIDEALDQEDEAGREGQEDRPASHHHHHHRHRHHSAHKQEHEHSQEEEEEQDSDSDSESHSQDDIARSVASEGSQEAETDREREETQREINDQGKQQIKEDPEIIRAAKEETEAEESGEDSTGDADSLLEQDGLQDSFIRQRRTNVGQHHLMRRTGK